VDTNGFASAIMGTPVVGVAIGLMFTYLIMALLVSSINEMIAGAFQWRGTYLRKCIAVLLSMSSGATFSWGGVGEWLSAHFTRAEPNVVAPVQKLQEVLNHPLLKGNPGGLPSYVPARDFSTALLDTLRDGSASPAFSQVEKGISALPDGDIRRILTAFVRDAGGDLDKLRTRIETWFDDAMDRLSGIYKRNSQAFLLVLGLLAAIMINVDSVHLATSLWSQPNERAKIVAQVQSQLRQQSQNPDFGAAFKRLDSLPLPIGRAAGTSFFGEPAGDHRTGWCGWNWWTILGWLITAVAVSLGAPFWFGLLQNIMNLRNAGPPPGKDGSASDT
jgi:hypothetical protein